MLRTTQHLQNRYELEFDPGLLFGLTEGGLVWRLIGLNRSTDGCPKTGVYQSDEEHPAAVIPGKYGGRREHE